MLKIAIMASGRGSNFINIHQKILSGSLNAKIEFLISNSSKCGAMQYAQENDIETAHISDLTHPNEDLKAQAMLKLVKDHQIDLMVLAGYMKKLPKALTDYLDHKIINIHPSLLPKFGGAGMFGMNVHEAVVKAQENESGATVHYVNSVYDDGEIIAQKKVNLDPQDNAEDVAKKVLTIEHELYWQVIADWKK